MYYFSFDKVMEKRAEEKYHYRFFLRLMGERDVGKSRIITRYVEGTYSEKTQMLTTCIPIDFMVKRVHIEGRNIKLLIWDNFHELARWRGLKTTYYSNNHGIIVVFDVTNMESFTRAEKTWLPDICRYTYKNMKILLVGNKCDLEGKRVVTSEMGQTLAAQYGCGFIETSAKMDINITEAFLRLTRDVASTYIYDESNYLKAISECSGSLSHMNIILRGPQGSGKTSLKQVILGHHQPLLNQIPMNEPARVVSIGSGEQLTELEEVSDERMVQLIAGTVKNHIQHSTTCKPVQFQPPFSGENAKKLKPVEKPSSMPLLSRVWSKLVTPPTHPPSSPSLVDTTATIDRVHYLRMIHNKVMDADSISLFDSKCYSLIDTSGNCQLQDTVPLLFNNATSSLQVVVLPLTEAGLQGTPSHSAKEDHSKPNPFTNLQYIEKVCQLAASCDPPSKVFIVGTHKDMLGSDVDSVIASVNAGLTDVRKQYKDVLICKFGSEVIFDMNTVATGEEGQANTRQLQEMIDVAATGLARSSEVALKWLILQLEIAKQGVVVSVDDCLRFGDLLSMEKGEVMDAINYFVDSGHWLLLHKLYDDNVPHDDVVLTKTVPFIKRLSMLVKASDDTVIQLALPHICESLRATGIFNKDFLDELFSRHRSKFDNNLLLSALVSLKVAVAIGNHQYFLPSALSRYSSKNHINGLSCGFALGGHDKCILPHGVYLTTVMMLLEGSNQYMFELCKDEQQYRDRIMICDESSNTIVLIDRTLWIQVKMVTGNHQDCPSIHRAIKQAMKRAMKRLHLVSEPMNVFPCPLEGHNHHCIISKDQKYICMNNSSLHGPMSQDMLRWIPRTNHHSQLVVVLSCICVCLIAVLFYCLL